MGKHNDCDANKTVGAAAVAHFEVEAAHGVAQKPLPEEGREEEGEGGRGAHGDAHELAHKGVDPGVEGPGRGRVGDELVHVVHRDARRHLAAEARQLVGAGQKEAEEGHVDLLDAVRHGLPEGPAGVHRALAQELDLPDAQLGALQPQPPRCQRVHRGEDLPQHLAPSSTLASSSASSSRAVVGVVTVDVTCHRPCHRRRRRSSSDYTHARM